MEKNNKTLMQRYMYLSHQLLLELLMNGVRKQDLIRIGIALYSQIR